MDTGQLTDNDARKKFPQLVSAVEYCHKRGIVHRDLKAENMLLDSNFNVKLVGTRRSHVISSNSKCALALPHVFCFFFGCVQSLG